MVQEGTRGNEDRCSAGDPTLAKIQFQEGWPAL